MSKEIGKYEVVTGTKINCEKSMGFRLGSLKGYALPGLFSLMDGPRYSASDSVPISSWRRTGQKYWKKFWPLPTSGFEGVLKGPDRGVRLAYLPTDSLSSFCTSTPGHRPIQPGKFPVPAYLGQTSGDLCELHQSNGGLGVPNVEMCHYTLCLIFLGRICTQDDKTDDFWKEDARKAFPSLRGVHSNDSVADWSL